MKRNRKSGELFFSLILLLITILMCVESWKIFIKNPAISGPGGFPVILSGIFLISTLFILISVLRMKPESESKPIVSKQILVCLGMVLLYVILMPILGFAITTFLFLAAAMWYLHVETKKKIILISTGCVAAIVLIFQYAFHVLLP